MNTQKTHIDKFIYILFAIFYLWMAAQIPYTHDDWDWGLEIGMQQWLTASINSRYVGNFFEIVMTRSSALKTLIMGAGFFGIPYLLSYYASEFGSKDKDHRLLLFLAANFLMLTMSRKVWSETYGWVAGFANFSISSVFMLLCLGTWLPLLEKDYVAAELPKARSALCFLLALCSQLFIENLSIILAAASIMACICSYIRAKRIPAHFVWMAVGALLGLIIMFSSSVYGALLETGEAVDGYRQLIITADGNIKSRILQFLTHCARLAVRAGETNTVLCVSVLMLLTAQLKRVQPHLSKPFKLAILTANAFLIIYFIINFILQSDYSAEDPVRAAMAALVNAIYFVDVLFNVWILYGLNPVLRNKLIVLWCLAISMIVPLIVTTECGYRLMFTLNVVIVLFILTIIQDFILDYSGEQLRKPFKITLICTVIPVLVCFMVYTAIGACTTERLNRIEDAAANNAKTLILPQYPFEEYLRYPDPSMEYRWIFFREFYGIANDVEIIIETIR